MEEDSRDCVIAELRIAKSAIDLLRTIWTPRGIDVADIPSNLKSTQAVMITIPSSGFVFLNPIIISIT